MSQSLLFKTNLSDCFANTHTHTHTHTQTNKHLLLFILITIIEMVRAICLAYRCRVTVVQWATRSGFVYQSRLAGCWCRSILQEEASWNSGSILRQNCHLEIITHKMRSWLEDKWLHRRNLVEQTDKWSRYYYYYYNNNNNNNIKHLVYISHINFTHTHTHTHTHTK